MPEARIVFMGTPELAARSLNALLSAPEFQVCCVVTQPDQPKGRGLKLQSSPVKETAARAGLPILQPGKVRDPEFVAQLALWKPDLIVVVAYGQILPQAILDLPKFGCVNVHTSLLPKYRGAAPIQRAILNGDKETGVTLMKMDAGMDTGGIVAQEQIPIGSDDTSQTLHDRLAELGARLLVKTLPNYIAGRLPAVTQPSEGVSYASKITRQDGLIDWNQPAVSIRNRVRAMIPWPGAFTEIKSGPSGQLLKIWHAEVTAESGSPGVILQADKEGITVACGAGALRIVSIQREGGRRLGAAEFLAGFELKAGCRLG